MNLPANINLPVPDKNIGDFERVISAVGGMYLLYDSLKKNRSIPEIAAAGFMIFRGVSGYCPVGAALEKFIDDRGNKKHSCNVNAHARLIIKRPLEEVYEFWRALDNLPLFMEHLESVKSLDETYSEWTAKLPGGIGNVSWKAQIVGEDPYRYIGWSSLPGSAIRNSGKVEFKDAGELGTLVHIVISYHAPLGAAGEEVAKLLNPVFENMVRKDVMGFKRFMETGRPGRISQETVKIYSY